MSEFKLQSSNIIEEGKAARVQLLFADDPDSDAATQTIVIDVPVELEGHRPTPEYRVEALRYARSVIDAEMSEMQRLAGRSAS